MMTSLPLPPRSGFGMGKYVVDTLRLAFWLEAHHTRRERAEQYVLPLELGRGYLPAPGRAALRPGPFLRLGL